MTRLVPVNSDLQTRSTDGPVTVTSRRRDEPWIDPLVAWVTARRWLRLRISWNLNCGRLPVPTPRFAPSPDPTRRQTHWQQDHTPSLQPGSYISELGDTTEIYVSPSNSESCPGREILAKRQKPALFGLLELVIPYVNRCHHFLSNKSRAKMLMAAIACQFI